MVERTRAQPILAGTPKLAPFHCSQRVLQSRPARPPLNEKLAPGNVVTGPAVIHTPITTIVVQDKQTGRMDAWRNIVIEFA